MRRNRILCLRVRARRLDEDRPEVTYHCAVCDLSRHNKVFIESVRSETDMMHVGLVDGDAAVVSRKWPDQEGVSIWRSRPLPSDCAF